MHDQSFSHVQLLVTQWTRLPGSSVMEFSRQEYWSGLPSPTPGDLPDPGIGPLSLVPPALAIDSLPLCRLRLSPHEPVLVLKVNKATKSTYFTHLT